MPRWMRTQAMLLSAATLLNAGCSLDDLLGADELPPEVTDPAITHTAAGARAVYNGALVSFRAAFAGLTANGPGGTGSAANAIALSGVLTDELHSTNTSAEPEDMRFLPEDDDQPTSSEGAYSRLHRARNHSGQAIELLRRYAPGSEPLIGHAYAIQGYAEVFLAEFFCSGIPLSTLDFDGDFTYRPGSTTAEVLERAVAHFDSAIALAGDSVRVRHMAQLGRARALLGLGSFTEAAAAVADVPDDFAYTVRFAGGTSGQNQAFTRTSTISTGWDLAVADRKGINGLDFVSSGDPRTVATVVGQTGRNLPTYFPGKYTPDAAGAFVVASGVEARLVEAEAALRAGDVPGWLNRLNQLRQTAWTSIRPAVSGPLPDLTDPGTDVTRVDLMFRERAAWLFLTGQRQGDLRRLIRHYDRAPETLYPIGEFPGSGGESYGGDVDLPVPAAERLSNPHFTGCVARGD